MAMANSNMASLAMFNSNMASLAAAREREDAFVPVDAERPWMVVPKQEKIMRDSPFMQSLGISGNKGKAPESAFRPLSMLEVGELDDADRVAYFADYKKAATKAAGVTKVQAFAGGLGTIGGGTINGGFIQQSGSTVDPMAAYEAQASAFGFGTPAPPVPGSFLPRAMQGQRSPTAPGAR